MYRLQPREELVNRVARANLANANLAKNNRSPRTKWLRAEFPGVTGFSDQNLWYMRQFYLAYHSHPKLQPLVGEISWAKHLVVMSKCKDDLEREFYIRMTKKFGWSKNVLIHQIENQSYQATLLGQTNFDRALTPKLRAQAKLAVKDEYTFDFLELGEQHSERELERALSARIEEFLRAMGGLFAFVGSQFRLDVDGEEYFIDLLLFHRRLRCLVAIDLTIGEFEPEHVVKMQFYLVALDKCGNRASKRQSASFSARKRIARSSNTPCETRGNRSASQPITP